MVFSLLDDQSMPRVYKLQIGLRAHLACSKLLVLGSAHRNHDGLPSAVGELRELLVDDLPIPRSIEDNAMAPRRVAVAYDASWSQGHIGAESLLLNKAASWPR